MDEILSKCETTGCKCGLCPNCLTPIVRDNCSFSFAGVPGSFCISSHCKLCYKKLLENKPEDNNILNN